MKKIKSIIFAALMLASATVFAGAKKSIVCTSYPEYDWILNILGSKASDFDVSFLQNKGTDLHSYQPSFQDLAKISECDMFVYVGGESDAWVEKAISNAKNKNIKVVNMMEVLGDKILEEEMVEGMQETEHAHGDGEHHHHHHHAHDEKSMKIFSGYFEDSDIRDRTLDDWNGEWKSVYPYLLDGTLDEVMEAKAENGGKSAAAYKAYYSEGYKTDVDKIVIKGKKISFYKNGKVSESKYNYKGYKIYNYPKGNRGVRFFFEAANPKSGAPRFIQFSDHNIAPNKVAHFHLYFGNESFDALSAEMEHWPTYYPEDFDADDIVDDMLEHIGGHHHGHDHEEEEAENDEHVWLSLKNAITITEKLSDEIQALDPANAAAYKENTASYVKQLSMLDSEYEKTVKSAKFKTVLFGDRFPFRYLVADYGLSYFAAFSGCSAESEASFETVVFLSKKIDELGLGTILTIEKSDKKIANTVRNNSAKKKQKIAEMDSLQSVSAKEVSGGKTYLGTMKRNLEILKAALN